METLLTRACWLSVLLNGDFINPSMLVEVLLNVLLNGDFISPSMLVERSP